MIREKLAFWAKVLGVLVILAEGGLALWKSHHAANADAVKAIAEANNAKANAANTLAEVNKANVGMCLDQVASLRKEMNEKSRSFAALIVQVAQGQGVRGVEVPDDDPFPRPVRRLPLQARRLQQKINDLAPVELKPMPKRKAAPKAKKAPSPAQMQQLYEAL